MVKLPVNLVIIDINWLAEGYELIFYIWNYGMIITKDAWPLWLQFEVALSSPQGWLIDTK